MKAQRQKLELAAVRGMRAVVGAMPGWVQVAPDYFLFLELARMLHDRELIPAREVGIVVPRHVEDLADSAVSCAPGRQRHPPDPRPWHAPLLDGAADLVEERLVAAG